MLDFVLLNVVILIAVDMLNVILLDAILVSDLRQIVILA